MKFLFSARDVVLLAGIMSLIGVLGCSRGNLPKTLQVSGKVTYQDKPLAGAEVSFVPAVDNKNVHPARGVTNDSGEYTLSTYVDPQNDLRGATEGDFKVTVSKTETMDQEKMREQFAANPAMEFKKLVPGKYTNPKETPLKATVDASKTNRFDFKLED